jgi:hypothetical protein
MPHFKYGVNCKFFVGQESSVLPEMDIDSELDSSRAKINKRDRKASTKKKKNSS